MERSFHYKSFILGDIHRRFRYSARGLMPRKILLIDDDPTLASEMESAFAEHGLSIDHAPDADSGLLLIEAFEYSVILLDVMLPRRSGLSLLNDMQDRSLTMPVVVVSGYLPDYLREALTTFPHAKLIVPKPIDPQALASIVAAVAGSR